MGHSIRVTGFVSPDNEQYKKHAAVLMACINAGVSQMPPETAEYFECSPGEVSEYLLEEKLECRVPATEYNADMTEGYEVNVADIPEGVEKIRFIVSW